jgi:rubrerythrin
VKRPREGEDMERSWSFEGATVEVLLEMAAMVEQGGFDFYARLTSRSFDQRVRNELRFLRDEEAVHKGWFLSQLRARGGAPRGLLPDGLREELDRRFFVPMESVFAAESVDDDSALRLGAKLEGETIGLFESLRGFVGSEHAAALDRIIAEEKRHRTKLGALGAS